jgi:rhamnosyltransferase
MVKVLVLLAAYNGEKFIGKQIESILNQSVKPIRVIINVDQSDDRTLDIIKDYQKKFKCIEILDSSVTYGSAAANFLKMLSTVDFSKYDFVALADQDDIWKNNKLSQAEKILKLGYDGYSSNLEAFWPNGKKKIILKNQEQQKYDHFFESAGPGCTFVLSKKLVTSFQKYIKKSEFLKINNYHDWLIYAFARSNDFNWVIDNYIGLNYRQHESNVFGANVGVRAFFSRALKVIQGEGFHFAFKLISELNKKDKFLSSLLPIRRFSFILLAFNALTCRRRFRDGLIFFIACLILAFIFPRKLINGLS